MPIELTLIGKPDCHLCDDARGVVRSVVDGFRTDAEPVELAFTEVSILEDRELFDRYAEEIPVVLVAGRVHSSWRVDPARLRATIREAAA